MCFEVFLLAASLLLILGHGSWWEAPCGSYEMDDGSLPVTFVLHDFFDWHALLP